MDTKKTVMLTSALYSLTKQIFSLKISLFHASVKNVLVKQSANVGRCRFHVANIEVAKQKGNVQTRMIKNMTILITANICKNIMLLSLLTIYIDHLLIHSFFSNLSQFLQSSKANVKQNSVEPSDIFFLN